MRRLLPCAVILAAGLAGCESSITSTVDASGESGASVAIGIPEALYTARAVVTDNLQLQVLLDGTQMTMQRSGDSWTGSFRMQPDETANLQILWDEYLPARDTVIRLASYGTTVGPLTRDTTIALSQVHYQSNPYDSDGDGLSNLAERRADYDPLNAADPGGQAVPNVYVPRIDAAAAPSIDGRYDSVWDQGVFNDTDDESLAIDNLMIGSDPLRSTGNTEFHWTALHDGTYLYVYALLEQAEISTPTSDSTTIWADDTVEIFLDGDNSKLTAYDGVNDYQFILPMFKQGIENPWADNNNTDADGRYIVGDFSAPAPASFLFHSCYCDVGKHTMEFRVALSEVGISVGEMFGIEVQYDDDYNGGGRDTKWGWKHPAKTPGGDDVDGTWTNPSLMGTAILQ